MLVCFGGVITGGYYGYQWATHAKRFAIGNLEFSGNQQIGDIALSELMSVPPGTNIFLADIEAFEARLEASPWISDADISRDLPNSLEIEVSEERAVALVELEGLYLANSAGELFKRTGPSDKLEGLVIITGLTREQVTASPSDSQRRIVFALQAIETFASAEHRPTIGEVHLDRTQGLTLVTYESAIAIHLGNSPQSELADRCQAFDSAWNALGTEEHAAARAFRIADRSPSDQVTVAFAGN